MQQLDLGLPSTEGDTILRLAQESRDSRLELARRTWAPRMSARSWRKRAVLKPGAAGQVVLVLGGKVLVSVAMPGRRPSQALDPVGWTMWEARLLHRVATAKHERETLGMDNLVARPPAQQTLRWMRRAL